MRFAHIATTVQNQSCPSAQNVNWTSQKKKKRNWSMPQRPQKKKKKEFKTNFWGEFTILSKLPSGVDSHRHRSDPGAFFQGMREKYAETSSYLPSPIPQASRARCWAAWIKKSKPSQELEIPVNSTQTACQGWARLRGREGREKQPTHPPRFLSHPFPYTQRGGTRDPKAARNSSLNRWETY